VAKVPETPAQILALALREAIGAPARADIGDQATVRLSEELLILPRDPAAKLLAVERIAVPANFVALLLGADGMEEPGFVQFIPSGFIDASAALAWSAEDMLASLNDTVSRGNPDRVKNQHQALEARRWVLPPHYNPTSHRLTWAALILPVTAPRESDGEVAYHAVGFGREGYVALTFVSSLQKAEDTDRMMNDFLEGLNFRPGKAYGDAVPTDKQAPNGLAGAMGIDSLHKASVHNHFLTGDSVVPVAGGVVAAVGALSLLLYIRRHMRREARRS
jgi:uncharacterized membrane-anchored protein